MSDEETTVFSVTCEFLPHIVFTYNSTVSTHTDLDELD